ncbi:3-hydroxyacyl-CoA dehydrogenase family protein [Halorussus halobius]|uniref:3-hydroxyacyl-CoA dehydrogenase family protein n=1 Tax=Halorussus halobius TaxID=1710537 RepID=UPI001092A7AF|nr:3-hydroxyacyl-CoA dehydrogenase family protein [Halorussus halobius]
MVSDVAVVGAGVMGHGLAVQFARHGARVSMVDHRQSNLDRALEQMRAAVEFLNDEGLADESAESVLDRIDPTLDTAEGVAGAELVIETVSEDLDVKHEVFGNVAAAAPDDAVLASNTSGIPPSDIAAGVPEAADRVVVCHWWNPPYLLPLVEVVPGEATSEETVERATAFVEAVDRDPIVLNREVPGFVWNRIQFAVVRECVHLLEEGVASLEDIDAAVRDGYALRTAVVGPFETMDLAGVDLFETIADDLYPELSDADEAGDLFDEYVSDGRTGVDAGEGFYEYDEDPDEVVERRNRRVAALRRALGE